MCNSDTVSSTTDRGYSGIGTWEENIKKEKAIMIRRSLCSNNYCPQKIYS